MKTNENPSTSSNTVVTPSTEAAYPSGGYGWYVVVILYLCYTFSFVDRSIITYLVEPIETHLQINDTLFGLLSSGAFVAFYAFLGIPVGRLADSRSRRNLLLAGVALWSTMTIMCGAADTYWELFLARMGVGVGEACLVPCAYSLITDYFPRERRSLPLTIFSGGIMLGAGVANVCGGMVAQYAQNGGPREIFLFGLVQPWQLAFILVGLPGIFFVATIATIREPARHERKGKPDSGVMFRYLFRHGATFTSLILGTTFGAMANMAMLGWAPVWFERRFGWNKAEIGTYLGIFIFIFGTIGLTLSGSLANRFIRAGRKLVYIRLMMAAEGLVIIPLVLAHVVDNPYWVLGCIGGTIFFTGIPSGLGPAALQEITPNEMRGQITAIAFLILALVATTVGGTLVGLLTDYVFIDPKAVRSSAVVVAVFASIMGIISLRLGLRAYERTAEENRASNK
ncbi:MAG: MFS transporter [Acidobacteriota bacterium]